MKYLKNIFEYIDIDSLYVDISRGKTGQWIKEFDEQGIKRKFFTLTLKTYDTKLVNYFNNNKPSLGRTYVYIEEYDKEHDTYEEGGLLRYLNDRCDDNEIGIPDNHKILYIEGLVINDRSNKYDGELFDARDKGYGSYLNDKVEEYARKNGCDYIFLNTVHYSIDFWLKMGYKIYSDKCHDTFREPPMFKIIN
jgi:hypothetical protein